MKRFSIVVLAVITISVSALSLHRTYATETYDKEFKVKPGGTLSVEVDMGSISVSSHNEKLVSIEVKMDDHTAQDFKVDFSQNGPEVKILGQKLSGKSWKNKRRTVEFKIVVPKKFNINIETGGGPIRVDDIKGEINSKSMGGPLHLSNIDGPIHADTMGGNIKIENASMDVEANTKGGTLDFIEIGGDLTGNTMGGSIYAKDVQGYVDVNTKGGPIFVENANDWVKATTMGGPVKATFKQQPKGDSILKTNGGPVTAIINDNIGINLETSGSKLNSDFKMLVTSQRGNNVKAKINGGGPSIKMSTFAGGINVFKM